VAGGRWSVAGGQSSVVGDRSRCLLMHKRGASEGRTLTKERGARMKYEECAQKRWCAQEI
jgi:hypothetical protein